MSLTEDDKQWITTKLEAVETRLLRAFQDRASPVEMRVESRAAVLRDHDLEIAALGNRISKIEPKQ